MVHWVGPVARPLDANTYIPEKGTSSKLWTIYNQTQNVVKTLPKSIFLQIAYTAPLPAHSPWWISPVKCIACVCNRLAANGAYNFVLKSFKKYSKLDFEKYHLTRKCFASDVLVRFSEDFFLFLRHKFDEAHVEWRMRGVENKPFNNAKAIASILGHRHTRADEF